MFFLPGGCKIDDDIDHSVNQLNVLNDFKIFITQLSYKTIFHVVLVDEEVNKGNTFFFYIVYSYLR